MNDNEMRKALEEAGKTAEAQLKGRKLRAAYAALNESMVEEQRTRGKSEASRPPPSGGAPARGGAGDGGATGASSSHTHQSLLSSMQDDGEVETDEDEEVRQRGPGPAEKPVATAKEGTWTVSLDTGGSRPLNKPFLSFFIR